MDSCAGAVGFEDSQDLLGHKSGRITMRYQARGREARLLFERLKEIWSG